MNSFSWPSHVHYKPFESATELLQELTVQVVATLNEACARRVRPSLVVSGGRTPIPLFERLAKTAIPWHQIVVTLADERWVDTGDSLSNEKLVRDKLLQHQAAAVQFFGLKTFHDTPYAGLADVETRLADVPQPFDLVFLCMGDDGHTASLFPDAPELGAALQSNNSCYAMHPSSVAEARISLTPDTLLSSREIIVHICGQKKLAVLGEALSGDEITKMPVRFLFQQQRVPVSFYWSPD